MILKLLLCSLIFANTNARLASKSARSNGGNFGCYWNNRCSFQLFGSKTPYDAIRGDLRDFDRLQSCQAVSFWSLHRHGNRNPGNSVTEAMKHIASLKDQIVAAYDEGRSQLCAQDIDDFQKFVWNDTLEVSQSFLTGVGYEELYDIATRVRLAYPELLDGEPDDYYFRPTNEQRTVTSAMAFVHGLTNGTNLTLVIDGERDVDDVIRPYKNCDRYQDLVKESEALVHELEDFENSAGYQADIKTVADTISRDEPAHETEQLFSRNMGRNIKFFFEPPIRVAIQERLGIPYQLTTADVYSFYESCRFHRSWVVTYRSPWCSVFTDEELVVLDYRDDVRHYYRNGYGSWVNLRLGGLPLKDLFENMEAAVQGQGKKFVSYFTHDTMMEMVWCAMGLYKDSEPLRGSQRNENRLWRSSHMGAKSINLMAVLNRCQESGIQTYRVQLFIGEKPTDLCPLEGCTWQQFQHIFQPFTGANLDFCAINYPEPENADSLTDSVASNSLSWLTLMYLILARYFCDNLNVS